MLTLSGFGMSALIFVVVIIIFWILGMIFRPPGNPQSPGLYEALHGVRVHE